MNQEELVKAQTKYKELLEASKKGDKFTGVIYNLAFKKLCSKEVADIAIYYFTDEEIFDVIYAKVADKGKITGGVKNNVNVYANSRYKNWFATIYLKGQTVRRQGWYKLNEHKLANSGKEVLMDTSKSFLEYEEQRLKEERRKYKGSLEDFKNALLQKEITPNTIESWAQNVCSNEIPIADTTELYDYCIELLYNAQTVIDSDLSRKISKINKDFKRFSKHKAIDYLDFCVWFFKHEGKCALCGKKEKEIREDYFKQKNLDPKKNEQKIVSLCYTNNRLVCYDCKRNIEY